jgi:hypothetical protein
MCLLIALIGTEQTSAFMRLVYSTRQVSKRRAKQRAMVPQLK